LVPRLITLLEIQKFTSMGIVDSKSIFTLNSIVRSFFVYRVIFSSNLYELIYKCKDLWNIYI